LEHDYPAPIARWNYHPEVEIHLIRRSVGTYAIGDESGSFAPGHVAIVGPGLAHDWITEVAPGHTIPNRDAVIQFSAVWLNSAIDAIPELAEGRTLVDDSRRGIVYAGATAREAAELIELVGVTTGLQRISHFFELVALLARAPLAHRRYVNSRLYSSDADGDSKSAADAGLAYVLENLSGDIRLSEAARLAYMSDPTFSRYFKRASGMTFSKFVRRLRIASACRMLDQTESSVSTISTASGYRNLANFNLQFRAETGVTPSSYRALAPSDRPGVGSLGLGLKAVS
jgi:AraC-like DNA-binding protein